MKNNRILALGILASIAALLWLFANSPPFLEWAFERHQNSLSWWARPLLMMPYCYFAIKQSLNGILVTILAILTSMFWFPAPDQPDPQVLEFLAMERATLTSGWNLPNIFSALAVLVFFASVASALWRRSVILGIAIAVAGAFLKALWSIFASPDGGVAVIPFALTGALLLVVAGAAYLFWQKIKPSSHQSTSET